MFKKNNEEQHDKLTSICMSFYSALVFLYKWFWNVKKVFTENLKAKEKSPKNQMLFSPGIIDK